MEKSTGDSTGSIQSVMRAFDIINVIKASKSIGVSDIARTLGLHKSTAYGLLSTLVALDLVSKNPETSKYQLTLGLYKLGISALENLDLYKISHPYLELLMKNHNETVHLVQPEKYNVVYIDKVECANSIRIFSQIGQRAPYYCTGVGKAILAFCDQKKIDDVLSYTRLVKHTKNTITNYNDLLDEFAKIRKQGYAIDNEEKEEGLYCVGAPIRDINGAPIAALSVSGPIFRMTKDRIDSITNDVLIVSKKISSQLGYKPEPL